MISSTGQSVTAINVCLFVFLLVLVTYDFTTHKLPDE